MTGPDREHAEVSMLALHLLQAALVHLHTVLVERVLSEPDWASRMTEADRRTLTPLFWTREPNGQIRSRHVPPPRPCRRRPERGRGLNGPGNGVSVVNGRANSFI
ncbi:MAG: Tn3 family transposase [Pseudonocardiaceae bacterium]